MNFLHRAVGNRAVGRLLQSETDSAAHTVDKVPPIVESVLKNDSGKPLDPAMRESMEAAFGQDLSKVRVHTSAKAAESAEAVNALAYTAGQEIVFGPGKFAPGTKEGQELLTHELTHAIQQRDAGISSASGPHHSPTIMRAPKPGEPETPSLFGTTIPAPTITRVGSAVLATIYFGQDSILLDTRNAAAVEKLSEELSLMYKPTVIIDGHASTEGTKAYNLNLSENRRFAVSSILKSKLVLPLKISGKAHGESSPAVEETPPKGRQLENQRALNRRVTILIMPSGAPSTSSAEERKKPLDLFPPMEMKEETPGERFDREWKEMMKLRIPEPREKRSFSDEILKKVDKVVDDVTEKLGVPKKYRGYIRDGAHMLIEKGAESALDKAMDQANLNDEQKDAIKAAVKAAAQTKF